MLFLDFDFEWKKKFGKCSDENQIYLKYRNVSVTVWNLNEGNVFVNES